MVNDLAAKFSSAKGFIKELEAFLPEFYEQVGQYLRAWVARPPKLGKTDPVEVKEEVVESETGQAPDTDETPRGGTQSADVEVEIESADKPTSNGA